METINIQLLPGAILQKIMLEVAREAGQIYQWQQGTALAVIARVSRSWCDLLSGDTLWQRICEGPEHWLIRDLSSAVLAPTAKRRRTYRHLYQIHHLLSKSKPVNPCSTVRTCRSPHQITEFLERTHARQTTAQQAAHFEKICTMSSTSEVMLLPVRHRVKVVAAPTLTG